MTLRWKWRDCYPFFIWTDEMYNKALIIVSIVVNGLWQKEEHKRTDKEWFWQAFKTIVWRRSHFPPKKKCGIIISHDNVSLSFYLTGQGQRWLLTLMNNYSLFLFWNGKIMMLFQRIEWNGILFTTK